MITIIIDNHAHRLRNDGLVESARITGTALEGDDFIEVAITNNWQILNPEIDLQIPAGDFFLVKKQLEMLHALFPADRKPLPSSEKVEYVTPSGDEPRI